MTDLSVSPTPGLAAAQIPEVPVVWIVLALVGMAVQLGWTGGERGRVGRRKKK